MQDVEEPSLWIECSSLEDDEVLRSLFMQVSRNEEDFWKRKESNRNCGLNCARTRSDLGVLCDRQAVLEVRSGRHCTSKTRGAAEKNLFSRNYANGRRRTTYV